MRVAIFILSASLSLASAGALAQGTSSSAAPPAQGSAPSEQVPDANTLPEGPVPVAGDWLFAPIAEGPDTLKVKAESYLVVEFGPRALIMPAFSAAIRMAHEPKGYPHEWCDGAPGYFRGYGNDLGSKFASNTARYGMSILVHEDFRYRPSHEKGFARVLHAIGYTFVDTSDSGHRMPAVSNFAGATAGAFVPNLWLPDGFNTPGNGATRFATHIATTAGTNIMREFAPEIYKTAKGMHASFLLPLLHNPIPAWWTKSLTVARP